MYKRQNENPRGESETGGGYRRGRSAGVGQQFPDEGPRKITLKPEKGRGKGRGEARQGRGKGFGRPKA